MDTQPDREDLVKLDAHINRLGIAADFRSNLISIASRLHYERTRETCMPPSISSTPNIGCGCAS